eukprot:178568_1
MGNDILRAYPQCKKSKSFWCKLLKSTQQHQNNCDHFFIELQKQCDPLSAQKHDSLDDRRVVFISLIGLFKSYTLCPLHTLYSALCVLPIKRKWLYHLPQWIEKDREQLQSIATLSVFHSAPETIQFIRFLQWKDSQGLLLFMLDEDEDDIDTNSLVHPFWRHCSRKICTLFDTTNGCKYNPLHLSDTWWEMRHNKESQCAAKYATDSSAILCELYFLTKTYKTMQEIIYQANPSMNPITFYSRQNIGYFKRVSFPYCKDEGEWYMSMDYETD